MIHCCYKKYIMFHFVCLVSAQFFVRIDYKLGEQNGRLFLFGILSCYIVSRPLLCGGEISNHKGGGANDHWKQPWCRRQGGDRGPERCVCADGTDSRRLHGGSQPEHRHRHPVHGDGRARISGLRPVRNARVRRAGDASDQAPKRGAHARLARGRASQGGVRAPARVGHLQRHPEARRARQPGQLRDHDQRPGRGRAPLRQDEPVDPHRTALSRLGVPRHARDPRARRSRPSSARTATIPRSGAKRPTTARTSSCAPPTT